VPQGGGDMGNNPYDLAVIEVSVEPANPVDEARLASALSILTQRDPSLKIAQDSGLFLLLGSSEHHLDKTINDLHREFQIELRIGAPQVIYRETVTHAATVDYTHKKQRGPAGQYARLKIAIEPGAASKGNAFVNRVAADTIPAEFIPGIRKGIDAALQAGVLLSGFLVVDVRVVVLDGAYHDIDSSPLAFEIAARAALRDALKAAGPVLLEPIMAIAITAPGDCSGLIVGDLRARRAHIASKEPATEAVTITAMVPLATMFGYTENLKSIAGAAATFAMRFDHYAPVPSPDDPTFRPAIGMRA
jgi:elongation factor G